MEIGAQYSDENKTKVSEKIKKFLQIYLEKYGYEPKLCHVNELQFKENKKELKALAKELKIKIVPDLSIQNNYFWIGGKKIGYIEYINAKLNMEE